MSKLSKQKTSSTLTPASDTGGRPSNSFTEQWNAMRTRLSESIRGTPSLAAGLSYNETAIRVARQVSASRDRLEERLGKNAPSMAELFAVLRIHIAEEDKRRRCAKREGDLNVDVRRLRHFLHLSSIAYEKNEAILRSSLAFLEYRLLLLSPKASSCRPAYFVAYSAARRILTVCIRGTSELADVLTDLSLVDCELGDIRAHLGIAQSAHNLLADLGDTLWEHVETLRPQHIVFTGHSLGAAVAGAMTILLRADDSPLKNVTCLGFCPPAFVTEPHDASQVDGVEFIVHGTDAIPRFSIAAIDRLVWKLANMDVKDERSSAERTMERAVLNSVEGAALLFTSTILGENAEKKKKKDTSTADIKTQQTHNEANGSTDQAKSGNQANELDKELDFPETSSHGTNIASQTSDMGVAIPGESIVEPQLISNESEDPLEFYVPGRIWHVEREWNEDEEGRGEAAHILEKNAKDFVDIEPSNYMMDDHFLEGLCSCFDRLIEQDALRDSSQTVLA